MLARDIEMFIEHCGLKGLSTKTVNSYEQTLRLFMQYMDEQGILLTEKITHLAIQGYIKSIKERGKYTVTTNPNSGNYPDRRVDFGKRVSDVTINNYTPPEKWTSFYGQTYRCNHPVYRISTLYLDHGKGLCVIQQRFNEKMKSTTWSAIDPWLNDKIYLHAGFKEYFDHHAKKKDANGCYPTVTVRQIMWALRMKPLKKERWETVFDRSLI